MKICYREINFRPESLALIEQVNGIVEEFRQLGYDLTLRQVYYQLVGRAVIPNTERSYKNLGNLVSDGRMAGLIDWQAIVDRTRYLRRNAHWSSPTEIVEACATSFAYDHWEGQEYYLECWVEKDALVGIVGQVCEGLDVPYFSCRGYVSLTEMWGAAQRLHRIGRGRRIVILHLGDHDPSGKDMSRDIVDRLETFGVYPELRRIALNMDQVQQYNLPPNPTKLTDSRCQGYIEEFGHECWELDALRPEVIEALIREWIGRFLNQGLYESIVAREHQSRRVLENVASNWEEIEQNYA